MNIKNKAAIKQKIKIRALDIDECIEVCGKGCYVCRIYTTNSGWVEAGIWRDEIINGVFYSGCDICQARLTPNSVSCSTIQCY